MKENTQKILLSPFFIFCLLLLLLNDFFLKQYFHNFLTGKISDFAGLFVFPLFFAAFFPKRKAAIYVLTAVAFIFWKSPFSQSLIDIWNSFKVFNIDRVIDYTDLTALLILPISSAYFEIATRKLETVSLSFVKRVLANILIVLSVFAFTATSAVNERSIYIKKEYSFQLSHSEIENTLKQNNRLIKLEIQRQTDAFPPDKYPDLKLDSNAFYVDVSLMQDLCDSNRLPIFFVIQENKDVSIIKSISIRMRCKEFVMDEGNSNVKLVKAIEKYEPQLQEIFEREVIEKLRQNSSQ